MTSATRQHGVKGVYYGGEWLDLEDCAGKFVPKSCSSCDFRDACPRSRTRTMSHKELVDKRFPLYDVCIVGAGCIGAAIARELSKYNVSILWLEAADDVSQGATKGNSGIVHAGYDDKPGTNRSKHCWPGNQMFSQLDKELRFGYQKNGSLVLALNDKEVEMLHELKKRGETNGVKRLRIVDQDELRKMEPHANPEAIAALYSPDAGNVIPYEFAIALAENAVDNGVELRIRSVVSKIQHDGSLFDITVKRWEPKEYLDALKGTNNLLQFACLMLAFMIAGHYITLRLSKMNPGFYHLLAVLVLFIFNKKLSKPDPVATKSTPLENILEVAKKPQGTGGLKVEVSHMLQGGSGCQPLQGNFIENNVVKCEYIINCAGGASDQVARLIGDDSFKIKPRLGDYLLLNRNQGALANHTLFPCPDPVLGKGVLVQTTLWGNLILGPTARDMYKPEARDMTPQAVQEYILSKCKQLVGTFDPKETFHAFCGARAKSDRGDWIIERSKQNGKFINVAGIDSPGLAGSPSIAITVCSLLKGAGLELSKKKNFVKDRAPIIVPKDGMKGLKMGPVGKFDSDGSNMDQMAKNVICKCEKVTELEVVRAIRRSLPIDSSQAIRKRTRAGMGHCQGDADNYNCEGRVRAIIARETGVPLSHVGGRPWPATSTLPKRWMDEQDKDELVKYMLK